MYRCEKCNSVVGPGKKMNRVVVETRPKNYPVFKTIPARRRDRNPQRELVATRAGHEIARELVTCSSCARDLRQETSGLAVAAAVR